MRNWKIEPKNSTVAKYIDCYWFLEKIQSDITHESPKLNPDPAGHLILAKPEQSYLYKLEAITASGYGNHLILPHCKTITMDHRQPFLIFGIKFQVGALYSLELPTALPWLDQVITVTFEKLFQLNTFKQEIITAKIMEQPEVFRDYFDTLLAPFLSKVHEDRHSDLVRRVVVLFSNTHLSEVGEALNCSQRTIERSFVRVTGFTLKQYYSMDRLEALLEYVHKLDASEIDWADTAFQFGFSDQPHLVRYLKSILGSTPGKYAQERDLAIDSYGNFE